MSSEVASGDAGGVRIPMPGHAGVVGGVVVSVGLSAVAVVSPAQGHAVLVAAIATPYLVFALLDRSRRGLMIEVLAVVLFVTAALLLLQSPAWLVAVALVGHAGWDVVHVRWAPVRGVGDYPAWRAALDVTAAAMLLAVSLVAA
ncbi:MAG: hypothetical protein WBG57_13735 [Ornithinimicrobium sp.]